MRKGVGTVLFGVTALFCAGCASPGPPKPPSLRLPEQVKDLSAQRVGDHVLLRWTTPSRTTDEMEIQGAMTAEVCRETATGTTTRQTKLIACAPVRRLQVTPGQSEVIDTLPPALQMDPVILLSYRIQIFNSTGHSAGESVLPVFAAAGQAPQRIAALQTTPTEHGAVLEWHRADPVEPASQYLTDLQRVDLSAPSKAEKKNQPQIIQPLGKIKMKPKQSGQLASNEVHLRAADAVASLKPDVAGTIDTSVVVGETYTYSAQRIRMVTLGNRHLEIQSEPSPAATLVMQDTFPPKTPTGLAAISGNTSAGTSSQPEPYVDLSWEPNGEADLAGYRVYRQLARPDGSPQGPLARLTAVPIGVPAYRDVAVKGGQGYIYSVTAVDAAANESAPSAKVWEIVEPPK